MPFTVIQVFFCKTIYEQNQKYQTDVRVAHLWREDGEEDRALPAGTLNDSTTGFSSIHFPAALGMSSGYQECYSSLTIPFLVVAVRAGHGGN